MKNIGDMMKQAQELQGKMQELQDRLEEMQIEGRSGGGLVEVTVNGKGHLVGLKLDPSIMVPAEKEIVEDLIVAAYADGRTKSEDLAQKEMQQLTGGLSLPPGMKLPF